MRVAHHVSQLCRDPFGLDLDRFLPEWEGRLVARRLDAVRRLLEGCLGNRVGGYELRALAAVLPTRWRSEPA